MPRQKAGLSNPRLGRRIEGLIDELERDCSDDEIALIEQKIKRLTRRSLSKALKPGGCVQVGPIIPPEGLIGVQVASTAVKALETLEAIRGRRIERTAKIAALLDALHSPEEEAEGARPAEIVIRYHKDVEPVGNPAQQAAKSGASSGSAGQ